MPRRRIAEVLLAAALAAASPARADGLFFDDFSHADTAALRAAGWLIRDAAGHPGVPGARWGAEGLAFVDDPERRGNRLLRLLAQTDGSGAGTQQAQLCAPRKFLHGTYAARVRFSDVPASGIDGDPVVMAFYAISPFAHDLDPAFSEVDFEYLPNGGWGSARTRLFGISWQTVQLEPWRAFNQPHEAFGSHAGWRLLTMHVTAVSVRHNVDGRLIGEASGRNVPVAPMALNFSLWFSPGGLLAASSEPRRWQMEIDWVLHLPGRLLSPRQAASEVQRLRDRGITRLDTVPPALPPLASPCNL